MTKAELIERIARSRNLPPNVTKKDVSKILGIAFEELATYFARAKVTRSQSPRFTFPRFGTFTKKKRNARRGVNPRTLEPMQIDACHILDFKASRELREAMNHAGAGGLRQKNDAEAGQGKRQTSKTKRSRSKNTKAKAKGKGNAKTKAGGRSRRLTPRDEEAELDALIDDEDLFEEPNLPAAPLQRARTNRRRSGSRSRNTG